MAKTEEKVKDEKKIIGKSFDNADVKIIEVRRYLT